MPSSIEKISAAMTLSSVLYVPKKKGSEEPFQTTGRLD